MTELSWCSYLWPAIIQQGAKNDPTHRGHHGAEARFEVLLVEVFSSQFFLVFIDLCWVESTLLTLLILLMMMNIMKRWKIAFQDQSKSLGLINSSPKSGARRTSLFGFPNILTVGFIEKREKAEIRNMGRNWKDGGAANEDNLITLSAPFHSQRHSTVQKSGFVRLLCHIDNIIVQDMQSSSLGKISL